MKADNALLAHAWDVLQVSESRVRLLVGYPNLGRDLQSTSMCNLGIDCNKSSILPGFCGLLQTIALLWPDYTNQFSTPDLPQPLVVMFMRQYSHANKEHRIC